jgi:hypothetical protein
MTKPYHVEYWHNLEWILVTECTDYTEAIMQMRLAGTTRKGLYRIISVYREETFS